MKGHGLVLEDASEATSSTVNATRERTTYQVYCSACRRYVDETLHPRCHVQTDNRSLPVSTVPPPRTTSVTAPVVAQHSVSRRQSNSASTAITVTWNNNSTVVAVTATPANIPPSSNGTEGEDESVIYLRCYECNVNVPHQVSINQSCHGPCQFCRVNRRHISCMEALRLQ